MMIRSADNAWWRHQLETFSALLAICAGNSPVPGEFPAQRPVTRSFDVFFDLRLNKRLSKQSRGWWFQTLSHPLWRHCNGKYDSKLGTYLLSRNFLGPGTRRNIDIVSEVLKYYKLKFVSNFCLSLRILLSSKSTEITPPYFDISKDSPTTMDAMNEGNFASKFVLGWVIRVCLLPTAPS